MAYISALKRCRCASDDKISPRGVVGTRCTRVNECLFLCLDWTGVGNASRSQVNLPIRIFLETRCR